MCVNVNANEGECRALHRDPADSADMATRGSAAAGDRPWMVVYRHLRDQILSGALPVESRLPSSEELRQQYGVSERTARSAVEQLAQDGLVRRIHGVGSFVRSQTPTPMLEDRVEALELQLAELQVQVDRLAATIPPDPPGWRRDRPGQSER